MNQKQLQPKRAPTKKGTNQNENKLELVTLARTKKNTNQKGHEPNRAQTKKSTKQKQHYQLQSKLQ